MVRTRPSVGFPRCVPKLYPVFLTWLGQSWRISLLVPCRYFTDQYREETNGCYTREVEWVQR